MAPLGVDITLAGNHNMNREIPAEADIIKRLFTGSRFRELCGMLWIIFIYVLNITFGVKLSGTLVVLLDRGYDAYFIHGIRVVWGQKPLRFSDGVLVSTFPDVVCGMAVFILMVVGPTLLLVILVRAFDYFIKNKLNSN